MKEAEQGGQPERRLARLLNPKPVGAARLPLSLGGRNTEPQVDRALNAMPRFDPASRDCCALITDSNSLRRCSMNDEGLRFAKLGRDIKAAVARRIQQLQQRLDRRNEALGEFMADRALVRSYLVRVAGDRMSLHGYNKPSPLHSEAEIASEQIEEIRKVCERIYELEQEIHRLRLVIAHLADDATFELGYDDLAGYGFEA